MKFLFLALLATPSLAALSPDIVKDSALKYHPTILAALEKLRAGEMSIDGARGSFDAKIVTDYKRQTKHDWQTTLNRTQLEKPLRFANSKVYAGIEQISNPTGFLAPIYNTGNPQTQTGNYNLVGLKASLWKDFFIDDERAGLQKAKYDSQMARADKSLTVLDISRLGQLTYWEWVTARKVRDAYQSLLTNGETRSEFLQTRNKKGDIARIVVTENDQYVASRRGSLQSANERLLRAEYALSLFYRNEQGEPIVPTQEEAYQDYPASLNVFLEKLDLKSNVDDLVKDRPDMRNLALNVEKANVDLELAEQDLKPQVDVTTEYFQRTEDHPTIPRDYLMVMARVSIPIERNLGKGNTEAARSRRAVAQKELLLGQQSYKAQVLALRRALELRLEQVAQSEIEFSKAKELVESESYKFKSGGGNLFLVNIREQAQASAEASFHESRLAFIDAVLSYQALVATGE